MKFSTKTSYGLRAVIRLAKSHGGEQVSLPLIAKSENISLKYLERMFSSLKEAKIVKSEKGASGGYKLTRKPSEISVLDIIEALEGDLSLFHCLKKNEKVYCNTRCQCSATEALEKVQNSIMLTLKNIKLNDL